MANHRTPGMENFHAGLQWKLLRGRMASETIEISVKGKWFQVPALKVDGASIVRKGKWLRIASVNAEQWLETAVEDPERCIQALKNEPATGLRSDIFTFSQKLPDIEPRFRYPMELESFAVIRVDSFDEWWRALPQESRKNVRRAEKRGVTVEVRGVDDTLIDGLVALNNDSPLRQGKVYTHFGKSREQVARDQLDFLDRSDYICAFAENELIGVVKLVYRGDSASILTFLSKSSHNDKRPANAILSKVVEICDKKKLKYVTFGLFNYHNKQDSSLREFKIRNGFEEMLVPRYYVPLTLRGKFGLKLKLHHGIQGILPQRVMSELVALRARWYERKFSRCSSMLERSNRDRQMGCSNPSAGSSL
jgi:hypothetical protein